MQIYDQGGYFTIKGSEKVIVAQERMACNFVYYIIQEEAALQIFLASRDPISEGGQLCYMVHRLCNGTLGRVGEDDRDHYEKKRLYMVGVLLGSLFSHLFRKFCKDAAQML